MNLPTMTATATNHLRTLVQPILRMAGNPRGFHAQRIAIRNALTLGAINQDEYNRAIAALNIVAIRNHVNN